MKKMAYSSWFMVHGKWIFLLCTMYYVLCTAPSTYAAVCGEEVPQDEESLKTYIADCNAKLSSLAGQKQTLSQALSVLNTQIKLTQAKISSTNVQLDKLNS